MPKLTREDWKELRTHYKVAFWFMKDDLFNLLLDKVYGPKKSNPGIRLHSLGTKSGELDKVDALMIFLSQARTEPPIPPKN